MHIGAKRLNFGRIKFKVSFKTKTELSICVFAPRVDSVVIFDDHHGVQSTNCNLFYTHALAI